MANYYVSAARGDDSTGTGTATNPWASISKAIGSSPAITLSGTGDTLYIEPGIYRELVVLGLSPTSGGPLAIVGDGTGAGFLAGGYTTPATGNVEWRGWTDDVTPTTSAELLSASGKSYVAVKNIKMIGGNGATGQSCFYIAGTFSNWDFEDVQFFGSGTRAIVGTADAVVGAALNVTFKRCDVLSTAASSTYIGIRIRAPLTATAEWDLNVLFQNCNFFGSADAIQYVTNAGSGTLWGTGIKVQQCGFFWCTRGFRVASNPTITTPSSVYGCLFAYSSACITATTAGQIVEDGNTYMACSTPLTNVSAGSNSQAVACPAFNLNDSRIFGGLLRPAFEPSAVSPALGMGNYGTPPTVDILNRVRPEGGGSLSPSCGATERHDTAIVQTGTVQAGAAALQLTGPGSMEWLVPVGAASTSLTIYTRVDANYGTTNPPVFEVDAEPQYGVSYASATASSSTGAWHQIAIGSFTPTSPGWVKVRVRAKPDAANGVCYIDTFGGATGDPAALAASFRGAVPKFAASTTTTTVVNIFNSEC